MIRSAVTVSLVPEARGGPFVFWDDLPAACKAARILGFDGIEVFPPGPDAVAPAMLRGLLQEHHLSLAAVGTGAGWVKHKLTLTSGDAEVRTAARKFIRAMIDFAGPLGAPAIIGSMQGRHGDGVDRDTAIEYLAEALDELGTHAAQYNVPLLYEPLNRFETNLINKVVDGAELLATLETDNVLLLADLFHMNIEEQDIAGAILAGDETIGHIHFVDSNRRAAGNGHIDFGPIARALIEIGYKGYLSAEAIADGNPERAARDTINAFRHFFPSDIYRR